MRDLNYELKQICQHNRDGSYATQSDRYAILQGIANSLYDLGFRHMKAGSLKPKHIEALITYYQDNGLADGTIKNRLSVIRWWSEKINKQNVVAKDNTYYGIGSREFVTNHSKSTELDDKKLNAIADPFIQVSLLLQKVFGLRREEAIKFIPIYADQGKFIRLKASWCKGGKAREIPVRNDEQRWVLDRARLVAGQGSLIPQSYQYIQQLKLYERETAKVGLSRMHGLRHRYAQIRYQHLTGWAAPACGGKSSREFNEDEKSKDRLARLAISQELGHEREQITAVYLGR